MSNALAIATVTAALKKFLQEKAIWTVPGAEVVTLRPQAMSNRSSDSATINLYLYQIVPNGAFRTADLPTRRSDGSVIQRPQSAWDLHYLFSFYGNETTWEEQRLLGSTVDLLHAQPFLNRQKIREAIGDSTFLTTSTLSEQVESIKFTPLLLNLEELSKIWSIFFQTPYALSIAYQASVVLIESEEIPRPVLPVRSHNLYIVPFRQPTIERVRSQTAEGQPILENQPILPGHRLFLEGKQLRGEDTQVKIDRSNVSLDPNNVGDSRMSFVIPPTLKAGVKGLQVVQMMQIGTPPRSYRAVESNIVAFVLRPIITGEITRVQSNGRAAIAIPVTPAIAPKQRVVLLLNEFSSDPSRTDLATYTLTASTRTEETSSIIIPIPNINAGRYLVRLQIDGAESLLTVDSDSTSPTFDQYIAPSVVIP
ncbi:MAG: DUF4255 domain-containing protein [Phormidium tanganyikae FI6-MK23]|jgi:hypothetical protein|nr:DUF4255 domain-containing protein [Phormidium tanganyikae FI6-MK23]